MHTTDGIHLFQSKYIKDLLGRIQLNESKHAITPMAIRKFISKNVGVTLAIVGELQYCTLTRPDISFSSQIVPVSLQSNQ